MRVGLPKILFATSAILYNEVTLMKTPRDTLTNKVRAKIYTPSAKVLGFCAWKHAFHKLIHMKCQGYHEIQHFLTRDFCKTILQSGGGLVI